MQILLLLPVVVVVVVEQKKWLPWNFNLLRMLTPRKSPTTTGHVEQEEKLQMIFIISNFGQRIYANNIDKNENDIHDIKIDIHL